MTVRFTAELATNSSLGCFMKLLFRWRGSVYKLVWAEYLMFIAIYYVISLVYRLALNEAQQRFFEKIVNYCDSSRKSVEMSFLLGFFVSSIVAKWWQLYQTIPWPDPVALLLSASILQENDSTNELKKKIVRHCNLNLILTFRLISPPFKKRYPTLHDLCNAELLTIDEKEILDDFEKQEANYPTQWIPIKWATELVKKAATEGKVRSEYAVQRIIDELDKFRYGYELLLEYEQCQVPLVYVQVVAISVYTYFIWRLIGSQWLIRDKDVDDLDLYFPLTSTLHFIFYMGWLKVAESLINPFGYDDDDFELEEIVKRHLQVTYTMVTGEVWKGGQSQNKKRSLPYHVNLAFVETSGDTNESKEVSTRRVSDVRGKGKHVKKLQSQPRPNSCTGVDFKEFRLLPVL